MQALVRWAQLCSFWQPQNPAGTPWPQANPLDHSPCTQRSASQTVTQAPTPNWQPVGPNAPNAAPRLAGAKLATQGHFECPRGLGASGPWQAHCYGPNGGFCIQITLARGTPRQSWEPQHAGFGALGPTLQLLAATKPSWHPLTPSKPTHPLTMYPEVSSTNSYSSSHTHLATCGVKCTMGCPRLAGAKLATRG